MTPNLRNPPFASPIPQKQKLPLLFPFSSRQEQIFSIVYWPEKASIHGEGVELG
jgi:hypothetical protein